MKKIGDTRPIFIEHNAKKYENRVDIDHILHARGRHAHVLLRVCEFHRIFANITDLQNKKVSNRKILHNLFPQSYTPHEEAHVG